MEKKHKTKPNNIKQQKLQGYKTYKAKRIGQQLLYGTLYNEAKAKMIQNLQDSKIYTAKLVA